MKKILLTLLLATISSVVSAASFNWTLAPYTINSAGINDDYTSRLSGVTLYLIEGDQTSATAAVESIANKTWTGSYVKDAVTNGGGGLEQIAISSDDWTLGSTYSFYMIAFNTADVDDATQFIVSSVITTEAGETQPPPGSLTWASFTDASATSKGWVTIVPEPTVLALLALGVAGLALKRKVA